MAEAVALALVAVSILVLVWMGSVAVARRKVRAVQRLTIAQRIDLEKERFAQDKIDQDELDRRITILLAGPESQPKTPHIPGVNCAACRRAFRDSEKRWVPQRGPYIGEDCCYYCAFDQKNGSWHWEHDDMMGSERAFDVTSRDKLEASK